LGSKAFYRGSSRGEPKRTGSGRVCAVPKVLRELMEDRTPTRRSLVAPAIAARPVTVQIVTMAHMTNREVARERRIRLPWIARLARQASHDRNSRKDRDTLGPFPRSMYHFQPAHP
jgi:hypothetical protein